MQLTSPLLLCPKRREPVRERVVDEWRITGGEILRLSSPWNPDLGLEGKDVCCYGGVGFCTALAQEIGLSLVEPPPAFLSSVDYRWVQRRIDLRQLGDLKSNDFPAFVKSVDYHFLPSTVYASIDSFRLSCGTVDSETLILLSEVVDFAFEARALICQGEVLSIASYHRRIELPLGAMKFVRDFAKCADLPVTYVADVGLLSDGEWVLVEINPIWAADPLYCKVEEFVRCLREASCWQRR